MPGGSTSYATRPRRLHGFAALLGLALGCAGGPVTRPPPEPSRPAAGAAEPTTAAEPVVHSTLAEDDRYRPTYGKAELARALASERGAAAAAEQQRDELEARAADPAGDEQLRVATADLWVRRRFLLTLEACDVAATWCPPRLDDPAWTFDPEGAPGEPPVTAALRFDLESWRTLAAELHGRACACRTQACVDSVGAAVEQLELRPTKEVRDDDAAGTSIVRARACLLRLRGKAGLRVPAAPDAGD